MDEIGDADKLDGMKTGEVDEADLTPTKLLTMGLLLNVPFCFFLDLPILLYHY